MAGQVSLSLSAAERAVLAEQGVTVTSAGLRSASGAAVSVGVAAAMLIKGPIKDVVESAALSRGNIREGGHLVDHEGIEPGSFNRPYIAAGHSAERAHGIGGVPSVAQGAQARADASDGLHADDVNLDDLDEVGGDGVEKRAVVPFASRINRPYLTEGHQANSPGTTGRANASHVPARHPAEPEDYHRGYLAGGHAAPSPGDMPANNPHQPGTPGSALYASAVAAYNTNQARSRADHVCQTGVATSVPATGQWSPPPSLSANSVPHPVVATASQPAPGER